MVILLIELFFLSLTVDFEGVSKNKIKHAIAINEYGFATKIPS